MITPTRIEVRNVRSVRQAVVEPAVTGITALLGPIGAGKSTILETLRWVLYGEVAAGLKQADMRRRGADSEPCEGVVEFEFGGSAYRAVRGLRRRAVRRQTTESAYAELWINGTRQRQITPSKLTAKIVELTGLTGRAFSGAFFIPQGQLATLADGTPTEVQQVFEDQTGLAPLTRKVEAAGRAANEAQDRADLLPGNAEGLAEAQQAVDAAQHAGLAAWGDFDTARNAADVARALLDQARHHHDELSRKHQAAQTAHVELARADERVAALTRRITELTAEAASHPDAAAPQLRKHAATLRASRMTIERSMHTLEMTEGMHSDAGARAEQLARALRKHPGDLDVRLEAATRGAAHADEHVGSLRGEYTRLQRAIASLTAHSGTTAACPTCRQPLHDLAQLVADLTAQLRRCRSDGEQAAKAAAAAQTGLAELRSRVGQREVVREQLDRAETDVQRLAAQTAAASSAVRSTSDDLRGLLAEHETDPRRLVALAETAEDAVQRQITAGEHADRSRRQLTECRAALDGERRHARALATSAAAGVDDVQLAAAGKELAAAQSQWEALDAASRDAHTAARVAEERCRGLEDARDTEQRLLAAKLDALGQADVRRHAAHLLAALRRDLLAEYTRGVSQAATDLLRQIGGEHVGFVIDDSFVPRVTLADGAERPTRVLSGGEKARAALCLRLGITTQIAGGTAGGTVFADEITAAHDYETRQAVMGLLRDLGVPLLIVAHSDEIAEIADKVIYLSKPDEATGTQVAPVSTTSQVPASYDLAAGMASLAGAPY